MEYEHLKDTVYKRCNQEPHAQGFLQRTWATHFLIKQGNGSSIKKCRLCKCVCGCCPFVPKEEVARKRTYNVTTICQILYKYYIFTTNLTTTEAEPLIYDYYKDKLIKKGMVVLKEKIKHDTGQTLLTKLGEQWDYFYGEILPVLQSLLYPVKTKTFTIRQVALLEFRNTVLLKLPVKEALQELSQYYPVPPAILQMLLVLHGVHEYPCTDNFIELEKLVAVVTSPHLGVMGLYSGCSEPEIRSNFKPLPRLLIPVIHISDDTTESDDEITPVDQRLQRAGLSPQGNRLHQKRSSGLLHHPLLAAVKEQDRGVIRRYSIATS